MYKFFFLGVLIFLANCRTVSVPDYSLSKRNILDIKRLVTNKPKIKIKLGYFSENPSVKIQCDLAADIELPDGYANYIKNALKDELEVADVYSETGNIVISGKLLNASADIFSDIGKLKMEITLNEKRKYTIESLFQLGSGCIKKRTAPFLVSVVQELNSKIINHPELQKFIDETR